MVAQSGAFWQRRCAAGELNVDGICALQLLFTLQDSTDRYFFSLSHQVIPVTCANEYYSLQSRHRIAALLQHRAIIRSFEGFRGKEQRQTTGLNSVNELIQAIPAREKFESETFRCLWRFRGIAVELRRVDVHENCANNSGRQLNDEPLHTDKQTGEAT